MTWEKPEPVRLEMATGRFGKTRGTAAKQVSESKFVLAWLWASSSNATGLVYIQEIILSYMLKCIFVWTLFPSVTVQRVGSKDLGHLLYGVVV